MVARKEAEGGRQDILARVRAREGYPSLRRVRFEEAGP